MLRRTLAVVAIIWFVLSGWAIFRLRKPPVYFLPVSQTLAEVRDRDSGQTFYTLTLPFVSNREAGEFFRRTGYGTSRGDQTRMWLTNTWQGADFRLVELADADIRLEWDAYPPGSFLVASIHATPEQVRCGDAEGYRVHPRWVFKQRNGTLEEREPDPDVRTPCDYNVLRVRFADGGEADYRPMPPEDAWRMIAVHILASTGLLAFPLVLALLLFPGSRAGTGIAMMLFWAVWLGLQFTDDYLIVEEALLRVGYPLWPVLLRFLLPWGLHMYILHRRSKQAAS